MLVEINLMPIGWLAQAGILSQVSDTGHSRTAQSSPIEKIVLSLQMARPKTDLSACTLGTWKNFFVVILSATIVWSSEMLARP